MTASRTVEGAVIVRGEDDGHGPEFMHLLRDGLLLGELKEFPFGLNKRILLALGIEILEPFVFMEAGPWIDAPIRTGDLRIGMI